MEKYFDAKDMRNVIDDIEWMFSGYREHSDGLIGCYEKYKGNELFQGAVADASKLFIDKYQITQAKAQVAMQQKLLDMYKHALTSFHEKVDKAPDARVDLETLDMVNRDLQDIYADLDEYVRYIEKVVKLLQARYGFLGIFTMPNFQPALDTFTTLCGGDNPRSGFIYDLKQKFINFDADECAYADSLNFEQEIDDANNLIQAATNLLEGYQTAKTTDSILNVIHTEKRSGKKTEEVDDKQTLKLIEKLKAISDRDMSLAQKGKDFFYDDERALKKLLSLDSYVEEASKKYKVDKAMIQAILYREIMCYGVDDPIAEKLVKETYAYKHKKEEYDEWASSLEPNEIWKKMIKKPPIPPIKTKLDSSTGTGQIFAETAINAYNLHFGTEYDSSNWKDLEKFWNNLQDDQFNVEMVALVLSANADEFGYDMNNLTAEQQKMVFTRYNGNPKNKAAIAYGQTVQDYYKIFSDFNN